MSSPWKPAAFPAPGRRLPGRRTPGRDRAAAARQIPDRSKRNRRTASWLPESSTGGTSRPRNTGGARVMVMFQKSRGKRVIGGPTPNLPPPPGSDGRRRPPAASPGISPRKAHSPRPRSPSAAAHWRKRSSTLRSVRPPAAGAVPGEFPHEGLAERAPARREQNHARRSLVERPDVFHRRHQGFHPQHHSRPAAVGRVVGPLETPVSPGGEAVDPDLEKPRLPGPPDDPVVEHPPEHVRKESQDVNPHDRSSRAVPRADRGRRAPARCPRQRRAPRRRERGLRSRRGSGARAGSGPRCPPPR